MDRLMSLGFSEPVAKRALEACQGDPNRAAEMIYSGYGTEDLSDSKDRQSDEAPIYADRKLERGPYEPGIIVSEKYPQLGPLLTILIANSWVQKRLNKPVDALEWFDSWYSHIPEEGPQSLLQELVRLCAFVHMPCGRITADAALLQKRLGPSAFEELPAFLESLEPLRDIYTLEIDGTKLDLLHLENSNPDVCDELDRLLLAKDVKFGPLIIAQVEAEDSVNLKEIWYPQRLTTQFADLNSKVKLRINDIEKELLEIRKKRFELRTFKGRDMVQTINAVCRTMEEEGRHTTAETLENFSASLGHERNQLMDHLDDLTDERKEIEVAYKAMNPDIFDKLGLPSRDIYRYQLVGLFGQGSDYFVRHDGNWFYVSENEPSGCSFDTVKEALYDEQNFLAIYSRAAVEEKLEPSEAIKYFISRELADLNMPQDHESQDESPSQDDSLDDSPEDEEMVVVETVEDTNDSNETE